MATLEEQILAWNPWWADAGAIQRDPHLRAFETAPVPWDPPLLDSLPLTLGDAHTVNGTVPPYPGLSAPPGVQPHPSAGAQRNNFLHLPMSFRDFCIQVEKLPLPAETTDIEGFLSEEGRTLARRLHLLTSDLQRAFRTYLSVGGFPAAIRDYRSSSDGRPQPETVRMLWTVIAGDIARSGRDQTAAAKLLEEVAVALGNPLKWVSAARAMGMGSNNTAREYVEYLSESFALLTVFFWDLSGGALQPSKQRKVYYMDPLLAEIPPGLMPGARRPPEAGMVENAMAIGLFRSAARALTQADPVPGAVGYWRSTNRRELDFVVPSRSRGRGGRVPIEVKGDSDSGIGHARLAILNAFGEGIVASRTVFDPEGKVPVLPIPVLLAGLAEAPRRDLAIG